MPQNIEGSFRYWVGRHKNQAIALGSIVGGVNILTGIISQLEAYKKFLSNPWFPVVWYVLHLLVILYLFRLTYKISPRTSKYYAEPSKAVWDFYYFLLALWVVWAILYSSLAFRAYNGMKDRDALSRAAQDVKAGASVINGEDAVKAIFAQRVVISGALDFADEHPSERGGNDFWTALQKFKDTKDRLNSQTWEFFLNCINNAQAALLLLLFWVLAYPRNKKQIYLILLVVTVGTILSMIINSFDTYNKLFEHSMGLLGGLFGGVAMALWVGRLDSKFLMTPSGVILALYFYAILQATWLVFPYEDERLLVITGIAMILKVVVYLVCGWLLSSGRLLYFFQEMRLLYGMEGTREGPMRGYIPVKERLARFLDDLENEEVLNCNE
jgi:hypothetical protein